jgi:hypothetical protein
MPVDLHQRLSEFSYGYGVSREVEQLLAMVGIHTTQFMPSLLHEKKVAFDVGFDKPGAVLLLQFKLGEALKRFRRTNMAKPPPVLGKPFWRFGVDTAEPDGQYDVLLKAEQDGAEVFYVAPRFTTWDRYASLFQQSRVLERSVLLPPSQIEAKLVATNEPDGWHRVVYDRSRVHVLSDPKEVEAVRAQALPALVRSRIEERRRPLGDLLRGVYQGFERRRAIRGGQGASLPDSEAAMELAPSPRRLAAERSRRLEQFRANADTEDHAVFNAVGVETWAAGCQLLVATVAD